MQRSAEVNSRRHLRSASLKVLNIVVPLTRRSIIGDRAFPVAASRVWNTLPLTVTSLQSLPVFKRQLKTALFARYLLRLNAADCFASRSRD